MSISAPAPNSALFDNPFWSREVLREVEVHTLHNSLPVPEVRAQATDGM